MNNRLLIAYATYAGSTAEVAAAIGETLGKEGYSVDIRPIEDNPSLDGYQAALVGSAVQYGQWLPEAVEFVKINQEALDRIPTALFCVHIQNLADDEESRQKRLSYLKEVRPLLQPVAEGYFAGKFDRRGAVLLLPGIFGRFMPSIDLRKWKKIEAWALDTSSLLHQELAQVTQAVSQPTAY